MTYHPFANFRWPIALAPGEVIKLDKETGNDYREKINESLYIRGNFLDLIIHIEMQVNFILDRNLISKNSKIKSVFQEKILNSKKFDLDFKIKILDEIIKSRNLFSNKKRESLVNNLVFVKDQRNVWAHGSLVFKQHKRNKELKFQAYISYVNSHGKFTEQPLTEQYYKDLDEKLTNIAQIINKKFKIGSPKEK